MSGHRILGALFLMIVPALTVAAQERELFDRITPVPPRFVPAKELKAPPQMERDAVRRETMIWVEARARVKGWKAGRFEFLGELHGSPADTLDPGVYSIYRLQFTATPRLGLEDQNELTVFAQGAKMRWPPSSWGLDKPPPGQNIAAITQLGGSSKP
jgi:hypothetical protein